MIEINLFYTYPNDASYAPRYTLSIFRNNILINKHYCGMVDTVDTVNNLYIISVLDVQNSDVIKIVLSKDTIENSTNFIQILKNSYINYKTF